MIEYNKYFGFIVEEYFEDPTVIISKVISTINRCVKYSKDGKSYDLLLKGQRVGLPASNANLEMKIHGLYEQGIVYDVRSNVDTGLNKYNTATAAYIIVKNDGTIKYIIYGVDNRVNNRAYLDDNNGCMGLYDYKNVQKELVSLGKRIDGPLYDDKINDFNKGYKLKLRELTYKKAEAMVKKSISIMEKALSDCNNKNNSL